MSMPHLTLVPIGGLCNRLRAIASVRHLLHHDALLHVDVAWQANDECAATWSELFAPTCWEQEQLSFRPARWSDALARLRNLHLPSLLRRWQGYDAQWPNFQSSLTPYELSQKLRAHRHIYIATGYELLPTPPSAWHALQPQPWISERIEALSQQIDAHTIGLHIRRTDNAMSRLHSPDHLWTVAIERAIEHDAVVRFYLATDDANLKSQLLARYPQRIITQPCQGTRSNLQGMEEAVVDLFTLARCSKLLGSYWSSFSDTAATLGHIPFQYITAHP